jgi:hypothetical protein
MNFVTEILEVIVTSKCENCHHPVYSEKLEDKAVDMPYISCSKVCGPVLSRSVFVSRITYRRPEVDGISLCLKSLRRNVFAFYIKIQFVPQREHSVFRDHSLNAV